MGKLTILWSERGVSPIRRDTRKLIEKVLTLGVRDDGDFSAHTWELSISFVSAAEIHVLNKEYRGKDAATDVLAFPMADGNNLPTVFAGQPMLLGDIVVCCEVAAQQAEMYGHSLERELAFLSAHGLLHLLGYDHMDKAEEHIMLETQNTLLDKAGVERRDQ